eukprot:3705737-Amphidinium_carterae.1
MLPLLCSAPVAQLWGNAWLTLLGVFCIMFAVAILAQDFSLEPSHDPSGQFSRDRALHHGMEPTESKCADEAGVPTRDQQALQELLACKHRADKRDAEACLYGRGRALVCRPLGPPPYILPYEGGLHMASVAGLGNRLAIIFGHWNSEPDEITH